MNLKPLTIAGLTGSAVWGGFVVWYLVRSNQLETVLASAPNNFGDFWAGTFAPLAFWWLVLGYFQQGIELRQNVEALKQQSAETANLVLQAQAQSDAIKANELHARRDTFFRYADLLLVEQNAILARIMGYACNMNTDSIWTRYANGNRDALFNHFVREVIIHYDDIKQNILDRDMGAFEVFEKNAQRFLSNFETLCRKASECDPDKAIREVFEKGAIGRAYKGLCLVLQCPQKLSASSALESIDELWS